MTKQYKPLVRAYAKAEKTNILEAKEERKIKQYQKPELDIKNLLQDTELALSVEDGYYGDEANTSALP